METQQLVVLNGDLITGENSFLENSTKKIDQIVGPIVKRGMRLCSTERLAELILWKDFHGRRRMATTTATSTLAGKAFWLMSACIITRSPRKWSLTAMLV